MPTSVITGPSSGIGRATALRLGSMGHHIVAAGRSEARTVPVIDTIRSEGGSAEFLQLDLSSLSSVRAAAEELVGRALPIDVMVNNAGMGMARGATADGFEVHFGVNHLGHFLFDHLVSPSFRPGARIVTVTSAAHHQAPGIDWDRVTRPSRSPIGMDHYAVSKLANVLYSRELGRRHPEWRTYAVHPGLVDTGIFPAMVSWIMRSRMLTAEEGAEPVVLCATDADRGEESGLYYNRLERSSPSQVAQDDSLAEELWSRSLEWCGLA